MRRGFFLTIFISLVLLPLFYFCSSEENETSDTSTQDAATDTIIHTDISISPDTISDDTEDIISDATDVSDTISDVTTDGTSCDSGICDIEPDGESDIEEDISDSDAMGGDDGEGIEDIEDGGDNDGGGNENIKIMSIGGAANEEGTSIFYNGNDIFIAGHSYNEDYSNSDIFLARLNEKTLTNTFDYQEFDMAFGITELNGVLYVGGYTGSSGSFKGLLGIFDNELKATGEYTFSEQNKDVQFFSMKRLDDYHFVLAGFVSGSDSDAAVYILDTGGNVTKKKIITKNLDQEFYSVDVDKDKNIVLAGIDVVDNINFADIYVVKMDSSLNVLWEKRIGSRELDGAYYVRALQNGNIVVGGYTEKDKSNFGREAYVILLDKDGNILWDRTFGITGDDEVRGIIEDDSGNIVIGLVTNIYDPFSSIGYADIFRLSSENGDVMDSQALCDDATIFDIIKYENGYLLVGGFYNPPPGQGDSDVLLIKVVF